MKRKSPYLHWSLIMSMIVVEAILNSYFFAIGSEMGLIGGFLVAILLSFVNVIVAYWAGSTWVPKWNHIAPITKVAGLAVSVVLALICIIISLGAAHYRIALETFVEMDGTLFEAVRRAIDSLYNQPFSLDSIQGFFLLVAGLVIAVSAAWKAYKYDDPYPGYGPMSRVRDDLADETAYKEEQFTNLVMETSDEAMKELKSLRDQVDGDFQKYKNDLGACDAMVNDFAVQIDRAENAARGLVQRYRQRNIAVRDSGDDIPPWFQEPVDVNFSALELTEDFEQYHSLFSDKRESLSKVHRDLIPRMQGKLQEKRTKAIGGLPEWFVTIGGSHAASK